MAKITDYRIVISQNARATEVRSAMFLREKIKVILIQKLRVSLIRHLRKSETMQIKMVVNYIL